MRFELPFPDTKDINSFTCQAIVSSIQLFVGLQQNWTSPLQAELRTRQQKGRRKKKKTNTLLLLLLWLFYGSVGCGSHVPDIQFRCLFVFQGEL